jgi:hypothetical protein
LTFRNSNYYIFPTHKLSVVLEKLRLSIASFVFSYLICFVNSKHVNFELATRVDDCTFEEVQPAAVDTAAVDTAAAAAVAVMAAAAAYDADVTAAAAEQQAAAAAASTGYQLLLCWCG